MSQWGQDFRPSYLTIGQFVASLPNRPPVGAFTATATDRVRDDIARLLGLRNPFSLVKMCIRDRPATGTDAAATYIGNSATKKFHVSTCADVAKIDAANRVTLTGTRDQAIAGGYSPCGHCNP